mgnify:FL=1
MKLNKVFALTLSAVLSISALAGCGNSNNTAAPEAAETAAESKVASVDDLAGAKIGVQMGTTGDIYASDYEAEGSTIERYSKGADAVIALKNGKIDCVVIDAEPAKAFVAKNDDLKILEEPFEIEEYAIAVSKDKPELTKSINEALAQLKADGTLDKIASNYIGDDTKGKTPYVSPEGVDRSKGKLVMATNAAFEPYEYIDNEKIVGIDVDMAQAVCDILGYDLEVSDMEFDSIITAVQSGKADIGVAGMTVTEERLKNIDFTDPYTTATQVIIVRK